ncbi:MAG: hypothetical protein INH37_15780, partial [Myxococcaceae bacterium]|nr:hypothetical protein [Myxococcaceae bacterium]
MRRPSSTRETSGLVLALVGLLGCTSGTPTKLCGAVGQPCCLASACDEGGRCGGDNLCAACGDRDQLCCAGDVCNGGFTCTGRLCTASLVCPTQCTVGTSQCTGGGGIETCIASGVCPEWRTVVAACPADTSCVAASGQADCVEKCAGACTVSALVCSATGLQECLQGPTDACPVLKPKVETTVRSLCVAGATAAPDFGWESPTPFAASSVKIAVNAANDIYVLDGYGNIIHGLLGEWTYELRPTPNKKLRALATCTVPSYAFAAGQGGTVFLRRGGLWLEEYVGQDVELLDIACDSLLRAVAVGRSGRIFVRSQQGTWSAVESTVTGPFNAVTLQQSGGKAWAVGAGGRVVRCDGIETPPVSCTVENVGVTTELFDVVVHERTNRVFAVGAMSTFISRGTLGTWASFPGVALLPRVTLRGVALYDRPALLEPDVMVVGDQGARWRASAGGIRTEQRPRTDVFFSSTAIAPDGHWFATEDLGTSFWYGVSLDDDSRRFGDGKPISESLVDVASAGSGRLFAVGVEGGRYRRENAAWSADTGGLALTTPLSAVAAVSANEVYAVGVQGTVYVRRAGLWSV